MLRNEFSNWCLTFLFILVGLYVIYTGIHLLTWFVTTMPLFTSSFPWFSSHQHHLQIYFCNKSTFLSYIKIVRQSKCEQRSILFFVKLIHVEGDITFFYNIKIKISALNFWPRLETYHHYLMKLKILMCTFTILDLNEINEGVCIFLIAGNFEEAEFFIIIKE